MLTKSLNQILPPCEDVNVIKLANDAASIVAVTLQDYMNGELKHEAFIKALYQNFPKDVAEHVEKLVNDIIQYQEFKETFL